MDTFTRLMECDESLATVLTWRPVGSVEADNLGWRFITTEGRTVAVRPVQLPSNARPFCVPEKIESALRAATDLILLTHGLCGVNGEPEEPNNLATGPAAEKARSEYTREREHFFREVALYEINVFIGRTTGKTPVRIPQPQDGGYTAKQRTVVANTLNNQKDKGAALLETIRSFILSECKPDGDCTCPLVRDAHLRRLVRFMGDQTGKDITLPVMKLYVNGMPGVFKDWITETAKARKIKRTDAERFLAERVTFIAECAGRRFSYFYPIEDVTEDVMNQEDRAPYQVLTRHEWTGTTPAGKDSTLAAVDDSRKKVVSPTETRANPLAGEVFPNLMTRKQACRMLHISQGTLSNWIKRGWIKKRGRGHVVRFRKDELTDAFQEYGKK